jgi:ABC-type multidrug transport system ATPase subunit
MIKLNSLSKTFGDKNILDNVNFAFDKNKIYILNGESGIGKTSLLNVIYGYDKEYSGECVLTNENTKIAYLFQDNLLFNNLTVFDNLKLSCLPNRTVTEVKDNEIHWALDKVGLKNFSEKMVQTLSGGEKQRVKLAQILLSNPDLILLDEPVSNLDKDSIEKICDIIDFMAQNRTVIIVSHADLNIKSKVHSIRLVGGKLHEQ